MSLRVRPAEPADAAGWARLRLQLFVDMKPEENEREVAAFFDGTLREPDAVLVAEQDGAIVGFAELSIRSHAEGCDAGQIAYLEGWFVDANARRRGVGRALIAAAEEWGRASGCTEFASDTQADNLDGAAAHKALGLEQWEVIRCFRKDL
jgi:aminoglycoside 6'-N-acetyltransferase I